MDKTKIRKQKSKNQFHNFLVYLPAEMQVCPKSKL